METFLEPFRARGCYVRYLGPQKQPRLHHFPPRGHERRNCGFADRLRLRAYQLISFVPESLGRRRCPFHFSSTATLYDVQRGIGHCQSGAR